MLDKGFRTLRQELGGLEPQSSPSESRVPAVTPHDRLGGKADIRMIWQVLWSVAVGVVSGVCVVVAADAATVVVVVLQKMMVGLQLLLLLLLLLLRLRRLLLLLLLLLL